MEYENGLEQTFIDIINRFKFNVFSKSIKRRGLEDCNFHVGANDGMDLHEIIVNYVNETFHEVYADEKAVQNDYEMRAAYNYLVQKMKVPRKYNLKNLVKVWGEVVFRVTGYHSAIGQVSAFALDPYLVNIRLRPKEIEAMVTPQEGAIAVALITAITTVKCPKIGDKDWKIKTKAHEKLRVKLSQLQDKIDQRNRVRDTNIDFHPKFCALSISS